MDAWEILIANSTLEESEGDAYEHLIAQRELIPTSYFVEDLHLDTSTVYLLDLTE